MPARRYGGGGTTRRKHSLGNLRRAHPASGATWNVQVVRGKMSSKCLWHACRALILGLTLMLLGAGMATLGYYANHLSMGSELRGNVTVRVKNDTKGFHLNNFAYVGPIVMGFGGFIVVASCVMTFEARDSAAKVVPARLRAGGSSSKANMRSNQGSAASQRRTMQLQATRWDHHFGVFRSSPADAPMQQQHQQPNASATQPMPFDRDALTAELIKFSKSLSSVRRVKQTSRSVTRISNSSSLIQRATREGATSIGAGGIASGQCTLLQPPLAAGRVYWQASSFDESAQRILRGSQGEAVRGGGVSMGMGMGIGMGGSSTVSEKRAERTRRSDTSKRHVLARQKPIEHEEDRGSPLRHRRNSTMSDSSYSGRWTARCASITSRASSIDSRRIQVDLHSPEVMPKSILRSPKRYCSGPSATPSVEREFRSQLSVCSEPPPPMRQLSGQSSLEPCVPEETSELITDERAIEQSNDEIGPLSADALSISHSEVTELVRTTSLPPVKKTRPDTLPLSKCATEPSTKQPPLCRSNSSRTFYRPKPAIAKERDDSVFYIRSAATNNSCDDLYDSLQVINERRSTLLKADSENSLNSAERKLSSFSLKMPEITERENSIDLDEPVVANTDTVLQVEASEPANTAAQTS